MTVTTAGLGRWCGSRAEASGTDCAAPPSVRSRGGNRWVGVVSTCWSILWYRQGILITPGDVRCHTISCGGMKEEHERRGRWWRRIHRGSYDGPAVAAGACDACL